MKIMKIAYQGISGSYSESCAKKIYPESETIPCKTFDECFERANQDIPIGAIPIRNGSVYFCIRFFTDSVLGTTS